MVAAIRTILLADLVMSLDNVIAVAAAAKGNTLLLIIGLAISIPLVIFGSTLLLKLMERFPIIITLGAALLGWVAGEMVVTDPAIKLLGRRPGRPSSTGPPPAAGAIAVVVLGKWLARAAAAKRAAERAAGEIAPVSVPARARAACCSPPTDRLPPSTRARRADRPAAPVARPAEQPDRTCSTCSGPLRGRRVELRRRQVGRGIPPRAQRPGAGADRARCSTSAGIAAQEHSPVGESRADDRRVAPNTRLPT